MFEHLGPAIADPILSISAAYQQDPRTDKIDLSVGVYRDNTGLTPIMAAVRSAEADLLNEQQTKAYLGLAGNRRFSLAVNNLIGVEQGVRDRLTTLQTPGGSGALRLLADLLVAVRPNATVWMSTPSYANHGPIMKTAGLKVAHYPYFDAENGTIKRDEMFATLAKLGPDDILLLHGCCHNPSGADLAPADWEQVATMANQQGFTPFVDMAYHGLGNGLEQDGYGLNYLLSHCSEMLATYSCSKHFGLYRERTGAALVLSQNAEQQARVQAKLFELARRTYTMPPDHGAEVVARISESSTLHQTWYEELQAMRMRIQRLRQQLQQGLAGHGIDLPQLTLHNGMFSILNVDDEQVDALRNEHGVYMVKGGRINVAGISEPNIDRICAAFAAVWR